MPATPTLLIVGLSWDHLVVFGVIPDPTRARDGLDSAMLSISNAGYKIAPHWFARMPGLVVLLKANDYDGIIIGAGVRMQADLTGIVNSVKDNAPRAKLLFNSNLPSTVDGVLQRNFPLTGT